MRTPRTTGAPRTSIRVFGLRFACSSSPSAPPLENRSVRQPTTQILSQQLVAIRIGASYLNYRNCQLRLHDDFHVGGANERSRLMSETPQHRESSGVHGLGAVGVGANRNRGRLPHGGPRRFGACGGASAVGDVPRARRRANPDNREARRPPSSATPRRERRSDGSSLTSPRAGCTRAISGDDSRHSGLFPAGAPAGTPTPTVTLTLTPLNQLDGFSRSMCRSFDPGAFRSLSRSASDSGRGEGYGDVTKLERQKQIVRSLLPSARSGGARHVGGEEPWGGQEERRLRARSTGRRHRFGSRSSASEADVEQAEQAVADARLTSGLATRPLGDADRSIAHRRRRSRCLPTICTRRARSARGSPQARLPRGRAAVANTKAASKPIMTPRSSRSCRRSPPPLPSTSPTRPAFTGTCASSPRRRRSSWRLDYTLVATSKRRTPRPRRRARGKTRPRAAPRTTSTRPGFGSHRDRQEPSARAQAESAAQAAQIADESLPRRPRHPARRPAGAARRLLRGRRARRRRAILAYARSALRLDAAQFAKGEA